MRQTLTFVCMFLVGASLNAQADSAAPCKVQVVLFVPSDVRPPTGYQQRIDEIVDYAESFFKREFKRWGIAQTGDGKLRGRESGISRPYTYTRRQWTFQ
jgi:hypothetical protein